MAKQLGRSKGRGAKHHIFLVPGFFGFSNIGGITYFHHVQDVLAQGFEKRGLEAAIYSVSTLPTGSLRWRSVRLVEQIAEAVDDDGPIHLIGHSTGGLDTRMLTSPGIDLSTDVDVEAWASRVASVVTVATPHYGTPLAAVFNNLIGESVLRALSLGTIYILRFGRLPLRALFELLGLLTRLDNVFGLHDTIIDQFYGELFADFDRERQQEIRDFVDSIHSDRSVVGQLAPGSLDVFDATTNDRDGVRYGSVVTRAARFSLKLPFALKFDVYAHASHAVFRVLQLLTTRNSHYFDLHPDQESKLIDAYQELPSPRDNDGVVPTLAQARGELIHATSADHLDVCGHFRDASHDPPHVDWFTSGSGFGRREFEALWDDVTGFLLD